MVVRRAALQLQSRHPVSALCVVTGDLDMQNKLATVGLPFVEHR
jgi:rRNA maturation endonuclease Nob1